MKKLTKVLLTIFAICTLACVVSACGGSSDPQPTPTPSVSTSASVTPTPTASVTPTPTASVTPTPGTSTEPGTSTVPGTSTAPGVSPTPSVDWDSVFTVNGTGETITGLTAYGKTLSKIEIPETLNSVQITAIGEGSFEDFYSLTEIVIPSSVTSIGYRAFAYCYSLTEIVIPEGVTSISDYAFHFCDSLTSVRFDESSQLTSIGSWAFSSCNSLTEIVIPKGVTSIGYAAFSGCYSLTGIVIPEGVTSIGSGAFSACYSLTIYCEAASKPSGWNSYWNDSDCPVVWDCKNNEVATDGAIYKIIDGIRYALKDGIATVVEQPRNIAGSITIPESVTYNGSTYAVTSIGAYAFNFCDSLTEIVIPESVTSIGNSAFQDCDSLTEIVIPKGVTSIGSGAFAFCDSLTNIKVDANNATYKDINGNLYSKDGTTLLQYATGKTATTFAVPDSVTSIGDGAFADCYFLTTVTFGDNSQLTSIGDEAFSFCDSLTEIVIPKGVTSIGNYAFYSCDSLTIYCKAASKPSGWSSYWNYSNRPVVWDCKNNEVAEDGAIYKTIDGIRYALKNGVATVVGQQPQNIAGSITIPASVTYKGTAYAVTSIGYEAFFGCDFLTEIVIPNSVTSIGEGAFEECYSLTTVTFGDNRQLTGIGSSAFSGCDSLTTVTFGDNSQLTSIGSYAFYNCDSLTEIVIPKGVTSIGSWAFANCDSLTIYCEVASEPSGWDSDWNKKGYYNKLPVVWGYTGE